MFSVDNRPTREGHFWWRLNKDRPPRPVTVWYERGELCCSHTHSPVARTSGEWGPECLLPIAEPVEQFGILWDDGEITDFDPKGDLSMLLHKGRHIRGLFVPLEILKEPKET